MDLSQYVHLFFMTCRFCKHTHSFWFYITYYFVTHLCTDHNEPHIFGLENQLLYASHCARLFVGSKDKKFPAFQEITGWLDKLLIDKVERLLLTREIRQTENSGDFCCFETLVRLWRIGKDKLIVWVSYDKPYRDRLDIQLSLDSMSPCRYQNMKCAIPYEKQCSAVNTVGSVCSWGLHLQNQPTSTEILIHGYGGPTVWSLA